jgi:hypothetical protein
MGTNLKREEIFSSYNMRHIYILFSTLLQGQLVFERGYLACLSTEVNANGTAP